MQAIEKNIKQNQKFTQAD